MHKSCKLILALANAALLLTIGTGVAISSYLDYRLQDKVRETLKEPQDIPYLGVDIKNLCLDKNYIVYKEYSLTCDHDGLQVPAIKVKGWMFPFIAYYELNAVDQQMKKALEQWHVSKAALTLTYASGTLSAIADNLVTFDLDDWKCMANKPQIKLNHRYSLPDIYTGYAASTEVSCSNPAQSATARNAEFISGFEFGKDKFDFRDKIKLTASKLSGGKDPVWFEDVDIEVVPYAGDHSTYSVDARFGSEGNMGKLEIGGDFNIRTESGAPLFFNASFNGHHGPFMNNNAPVIKWMQEHELLKLTSTGFTTSIEVKSPDGNLLNFMMQPDILINGKRITPADLMELAAIFGAGPRLPLSPLRNAPSIRRPK